MQPDRSKYPNHAFIHYMIKRFASLPVQFIALGTLLFTALGFLGHLDWRLDLFAHFRMHYALAALGTGVLLVYLRKWLMLGIPIVALLVNGWLLAPYYLTARDSLPANGRPISFIIFNVLMENRRSNDVLAYLQAQHPDIIALTEVDLAWTVKLKPLEQDYPYRRLVPRGGHAGVAIYSRLPFTGEAVLLTPRGFWSVIGDLSVGDQTVQLVLTHPVAPTNQRSAQLRDTQIQAIADLVQQGHKPTLVLGDFNASPWSVAFEPLQRQSPLRDSALSFGLQPTWNAFNFVTRTFIDHVWVPPEFAVLNHHVGPALGSDHFPVEVTLAWRGS